MGKFKLHFKNKFEKALFYALLPVLFVALQYLSGHSL